MALETILPAPFQYPHEQAMFADLERSLRQLIGTSSDHYVLVGNYHVANRELDALFIGPGNVTVIEMKSYGGRVRVSENGPWLVNGDEMQQSADGNPFRQTRTYRFELLRYIQGKSATYRIKEWGRISGMVLFSRPIMLDNNIGPEIAPWFLVKDLSQAANALISKRDSGILRNNDEIDRLKEVLDLRRPAVAAKRVEPAPQRFEVTHIRQSDFVGALGAMRGSGLELAAAVRVITERIESVKKLPLRNPFADLQSRLPKEIPGSIAYSIGDKVELVCLQEGHSRLFPLFAGPRDLVADWLTRNGGLTLTIDGSDYRLSLTLATAPSNPPPALPPAPLTERTDPYLKALACPELEAALPSGLLRRALQGVSPVTPDSEIEEILESLQPETSAFFRDLFRLLRASDVEGARARLNLRSGNSVIASDTPGGLSEAVAANSNSDQVIVLSDLSPDDMKRILDLDRFHEWMYYLHPDQKKYVERDYEKPVVLTGVSGSGKTCILVHRARTLARKHPDERIAIFTLNHNLAGLLRDLVEKLMTPEERKNVFVYPFYDYFSELLHQLGADDYLKQLARAAGGDSPMSRSVDKILSGKRAKEIARKVDTRSQETLEDTWDNFLDLQDHELLDLMRPVKELLLQQNVNQDRYLREEFTLIRSMWPPEDRKAQYPGFDRSDFSRAVPFRQDIRFIVLKLLLRYEEFMLEGGMLDVLSLTHALLPLRQKIGALPDSMRFRHVLIDEFQDFSNLDLVIIRAICTHSAQDGLFLAGDLVQKILVKKLVLRDAGFDNTASHWLRIRKNFRNSRQILLAAAHLAKTYGEMAKSRKEEMEVLDPELAVRETAAPTALQTDSPVDKAWEIASRIVCVEKRAPWTICIATANKNQLSTEHIMKRRPVGMAAQLLSPDWIKKRDCVVVCDIHELKGFEFHLVLVVGLEKNHFPESGVPEEEIWRDALRLYVAMTRARDELYLLFKERPSIFLESMRPYLNWSVENLTVQLGLRHGDSVKSAAIAETSSLPDTVRTVSEKSGCFDWFTPIQIRMLKDFFILKIEGVSLPEQGTKDRERLQHQKDGLFKHWLTPGNLLHVSHQTLAQFNKVLADEIQGILRAHGRDLGAQDSHVDWRPPIKWSNIPAPEPPAPKSLKELRARHRKEGRSGSVLGDA
jgi:superfamily I DNA/RNA helicase